MQFEQPRFLQYSNIYEVNIRQYTPEGSFKAFAAHLPRLKDMGVEILWLMPIHPIGKVKRKGTLGSYYSIKDHRGVNSEFGSDDDFKSLIHKVHEAGMKIIIDWVANHTSWDHVWTISHPDFFIKDETGSFKSPYDWDDVIQIDHANKNEQAAMAEAMQYWITEFDIDGFRADLAHLTPLQFWKDARTKLSSVKENLIWLAETEEPSYHEAFDISYTWKWMHETEKFAKQESKLSDCINVLKTYNHEFPANALRLFFTTNHDENSWNGTEFEKYGELAKAFAVFSFTYPGIPLLYSGQELPNKKRLKFFDKDEIAWGDVYELHDFYKTLYDLRKRNIAITASPGETFFIEESIPGNTVIYMLSRGEQQIIVCLCLGDAAISSDIYQEKISGKYKNIFTGEIMELSGKYNFDGTAGDFAVLEKLPV